MKFPLAYLHRAHFAWVFTFSFILAMFFCASNSVIAQNLLSDPGFESVPGGVETNVIAGWTTYGQGFNTLAETGTNIARTGSNYFKLFQGFIGIVNYNGIFQDIPSTPGNVYTADGWARTSSSDQLAGNNLAWIEVTFRDLNANIIALYRSAIISTNSLSNGSFPLNTWVHLPITNQYDPSSFNFSGTTSNLVAPPGTAFVRYQIMFQGDQYYSGGSMFFDDQNLALIPAGTVWNIVWNDEFNGTVIDPKHWQFETGNGSGGWGNNELEYYTSRPANAFVTNGALHIMAKKESFAGFNYTSARMKTDKLFARKYGRFEFRAKLPTGKGYWPAIWMMPEDSVYGGWAASGEIDIMENKGSNPTNVLGTIHYGGPYPYQTQSFGPSYNLGPGDSVTNFHTYRLDWTNNRIDWYVDNHIYERQTNWFSATDPNNQSNHNAYPAPFDQPFYLILNLAVGGNFDGNPDGTTIFPGEMQLDYIRVYDLTAPLQISLTQSKSNVTLAWPANIVCHLQAQTNSAGSPSANWVDVTNAPNPFTVSFSTDNRAVFYRLVSP